MDIKIKDSLYSVDECFDLLGIKTESINNNFENIFLDANGNYTFSFDLKMDYPNQVMNSGLISIDK